MVGVAVGVIVLGVSGDGVEWVFVGIMVCVFVDMSDDDCCVGAMLGDGEGEHVGIPANLRFLL